MDTIVTKDDVLALLSRHIGRKNGVSAAFLATELDVSERFVRRLVSQLREDGNAIGAHPAFGYFVCADKSDFDVGYEFMYARAMKSLRLIAQMKRCSLAELLGQEHLNT